MSRASRETITREYNQECGSVGEARGPRTRCHRDNLKLFFSSVQGSESAASVHRAFSELNLLDRKRREARRVRCTYTGSTASLVRKFFERQKSNPTPITLTQFSRRSTAHAHDTSRHPSYLLRVNEDIS